METIPENNPPDSEIAKKSDASTDTGLGFCMMKRSSIGKKLDPFLLRAILLKMENKGLKSQVQHRKRVEFFHRVLCERYAYILEEYNTFVPEPVVQAEESNQVDPSTLETDRIEQLAKRISHIKISSAQKKKMVAELIDEGDFKKVDGLFDKTSVKGLVTHIMKKPNKPRTQLNTPEQSELACHRWQVSIGLILGLAKIAAFSMFEEKEQYKVCDLIFEPTIIKETKNVDTLSSDSKFTLGLTPEKRSVEQVEQVVKNIHVLGIKSFEEYPYSVQLQLARVARYEIVTQQRVIMKQGRPAEHFYFLIEGTVVAIEKGHYTELEDTENGEVILNEDESEDLVILRKGSMFGETEMVNRLKRRITAISKVRAELLSIERHEFLRILVKRPHLHELPDHIQFLQQCEFIEQWPVENLVDDLDHCSPYFFKKNSMIVEDSMKTDFLVVIRTGECRVIRKLYKKKLLTDVNPEQIEKSERIKMRDYNDEQLRKNFRSFTHTYSMGSIHEAGVNGDPGTTTDRPHTDELIDGQPPTASLDEGGVSKSKPPIASTESKCLEDKSKTQLERHVSKKLSRHLSSKMKTSSIDNYVSRDWLMENNKDDDKVPVFIQIDVLGENEIFGLDTLMFDKYYDSSDHAGLCLVSSEKDAGVEVVLLSKSCFVEHASEQVAWRVRRMMKNYPDTAWLLDEIERQELWGVSRAGMKEDVFTGRPLFLKKLSWKV